MTLRGAMQDDFDALSTGFFQILGTDSHGRAILFQEKARMNPQHHHQSSLFKCVFYIVHVATSDLKIQKKGAVLINNSSTATMKDFDRLCSENMCKHSGIRSYATQSTAHSKYTKLVNSFTNHLACYAGCHIQKYRVLINIYSSVEELEDYGLLLTDILSSK